MIVNQTFVRRYFKGSDPIGQRLVMPGNSETGISARTAEIVGVARDNKATTPNSDRIPVLYSPQLSTSLLVRVRGPATAWLLGLEQAVNRRRPDATVTAALIANRLRTALAPMRVAAFLMGALGGAALILAMTGLYGVVGYAVKRRSFEIGVRMALGATRSTVMRLILHESLVMLGVGCAAGGIAAIMIIRAVRTTFAIDHSLVDVIALASVFGVLLATGVIASLPPAKRAATMDPIVTLRHE